MPKGETVVNVVIDGKGGSRCRNRNSYKETKTDNGGNKTVYSKLLPVKQFQCAFIVELVRIRDSGEIV